tara:strand:- start:281 stop:544 length:264 start_codon:yes stop_codon:yes gene_type:complete
MVIQYLGETPKGRKLYGLWLGKDPHDLNWWLRVSNMTLEKMDNFNDIYEGGYFIFYHYRDVGTISWSRESTLSNNRGDETIKHTFWV